MRDVDILQRKRKKNNFVSNALFYLRGDITHIYVFKPLNKLKRT